MTATLANLTLAKSIATAPAAPTAPQAALTLIRDSSIALADLARMFGQGETWAAGLIHAVCGEGDFAFAASQDDYQPTAGEMADYQDGFRHGIELMERDARADGWADNDAAQVDTWETFEPLPAVR